MTIKAQSSVENWLSDQSSAMNSKTTPKKFTFEQIQQTSEINLADHFHGRLPVFGITIDDATTVDRDDGIWLIDLKNGSFELQVSITDVSAIIPPDSPVDKEALARVVTLYHTNPATPMLPCSISTNLGSLEEGQKRLALTVFFQIDNQGKIKSFRIKETVFSSIRAFSYDQVEKILANPSDNSDDQLLLKMQNLAHLLSKGRKGKSGILTADGYVDEDGNLIEENVNTHQLIAELMILTNTTIANFLAEQEIPALFRTQDVGMEDLETAMKEMGHCLVPATYASYPLPHVGLGLPAYCHFTSPLRRFVDLVNHRIVKALINKEKSYYTKDELDKIAEHINNFQQQYKLDRANYLRNKKQKDLEKKFSDITPEEINQLSESEFSDLIQFYVYRKRNKIEQIIPEVKTRIEQLQPKDFYYLWFIGKINDFFSEAKEAEINGISILLVKSQLDNSSIDYHIEYCDVRQLYFAYCYLDGLTAPNPASDGKKTKAKNKSALAVIEAYIKQTLTDNPNSIAPVNVNNILENKSENSIKKKKNNGSNKSTEITLDNLDIHNLSDKEFSKVLDYAVNTKIESDFLKEVGKRVKTLQPKDLYKLWFVAKVNCFFDYPNFDAVSVLVIHSQLTDAKIEYQVDYHFETQTFIASCYVNGLTSPIVETDVKKARAKQKSALAYIKSFLENTLTSEPKLPDFDEKQETITDLVDLEVDNEASNDSLNLSLETESESSSKNTKTETKTKENDSDWISILHKFCQTQQIDYPVYDFRHIDGFFSCTIKLNYLNQTLSTESYGKNKKEAKKSVSKVFMIQYNLLNDNE